MTKPAKKIISEVVYAVIVVGIVLAVWSVAAKIVGTSLILPTVGETFSAFSVVFYLGAFWTGLGGTLLRSVIGFAVSLVCFAPIYFFCTTFLPFARLTEPIISALRALPTMAVTLVLAVWAGGYYAPIIIAVLVIVPYIYSSVKSRNSAVPKELKEICVICGAGRTATFFALWFPHAAAGLPETLSSGFSFGVKAVVAAEILMQTANSLGQLMNLAKVYFETAKLIAFVFIAVATSVILEYLLRVVLGLLLKRYID